jgi:adenosylhomocysteine nucleosidase
VTRLLVLTALDLEARALARHLGLPPGSRPRGAGGRDPVQVIAVGVRAIHLDTCVPGTAPELVLSAGVCGGLAPGLPAGALVVPEVVLTADGDRLVPVRAPGLEAHGTLATTRDIVATAADKARLHLRTGAIAADMESAAILTWAAARGWPALVVRAVADPSNRAVPRDLAAVIDDDGRVHPFRAIRTALTRPGAIPDALALRAGTEAALLAVARAVARLASGSGGIASPAGRRGARS